jgi:hypothetical protein
MSTLSDVKCAIRDEGEFVVAYFSKADDSARFEIARFLKPCAQDHPAIYKRWVALLTDLTREMIEGMGVEVESMEERKPMKPERN